MIIETPYKQNDTITVKTVAGEEVVARFNEEDEKTITVERPMSVIATAQGAGLVPFAFTIHPQSKVKLNKSAIVFVHKTDDEMGKQYVTSTTGIKLN
jgi:hypothetical protein